MIQSRITTPTLPSPSEKDLSKIIRLLCNAITVLYQRDSEKEKRVRALESKHDRGSAKYSTEKYFGEHFKFVAYESPARLALYYSEDGINWPDIDDTIEDYNP